MVAPNLYSYCWKQQQQQENPHNSSNFAAFNGCKPCSKSASAKDTCGFKLSTSIVQTALAAWSFPLIRWKYLSLHCLNWWESCHRKSDFVAAKLLPLSAAASPQNVCLPQPIYVCICKQAHCTDKYLIAVWNSIKYKKKMWPSWNLNVACICSHAGR